MTSNTRVFLGAGCGCLAIAAVIILVGGYFLLNHIEARLDESTKAFEIEGREFGSSADQQGCINEALRRSRSSGAFNLDAGMTAAVFLDACLETSRPTPDFCERIPSSLSLSGPDWDKDQCIKLGFDPYKTGCVHVFYRKRNFCSSQPERNR